MSFYANLKIRNKLITGYALVVLFSCLIGFFGIKGMSDIKASLDDLQNRVFPSIALLAEIDHHSQLHRRYFLRYLPGVVSEQRRNVEDNLDKEERLLRETLEKFSKFSLVPDERRLLASAVTAAEKYLTASAVLRKKAASGEPFERLQGENQQLFLIFSDFEKMTDQLAQLNADEVKKHFNLSNSSYQNLHFWLSLLTVSSVLLAIAMTWLITRSIVNPLRLVLKTVRSQQQGSKEKARLVEAIAGGDLNHKVIVAEPLKLETEQIGKDEAGILLKAIVEMSEVQHSFDLAFARMADSLRNNHDEEIERDWFKSGQNELNNILRGDKKSAELADKVLAFIIGYIDAGVGIFYLYNEKDESLESISTYALAGKNRRHERIALGEGLVGQAAQGLKIIHLTTVPHQYLPIGSVLGEVDPLNIVVLPILNNHQLVGVVEIGSFHLFTPVVFAFLNQSMEGVAIALSVNRSREMVKELLEQTQAQAEELRVQQEELQQTNEELQERTQLLEQQRGSRR